MSQRLSILSPLLNRRSSLSIGDGILLYKQQNPPYHGLCLSGIVACGPKSSQVAPGNPVHASTGALWYVSNLELHSDLGVPYLAEHIRSIAESLYSTFPDAENPPVWQLGSYLAYSRDVWKLVKTCTRVQNSISAFSPDGVSLIVEAFTWNNPNCWVHNPEVSKPNSDQDQSPLCVVPIRVFPGCKANARTVTPKGPWTNFEKKNTGNARLQPSG